jgi:serine/threonine protein kinase
MATTTHIFIAHAGNEKSVALRLVDDLEARGLTCWIAPRDVPAGRAYADGIMQAITEAACMLVVFTPSVNTSPHLESEIERAFSLRVPIVVVRFCEDAFSPALSYFLDKTQWITAMGPQRSAALAKIVQVVEGLPSRFASNDRELPTLHTEAKGGDGASRTATSSSKPQRDMLASGMYVGPYRIERMIASGGMGDVLLATRDDGHVKMQVAIKVIKRGMDTAEVLRRFSTEKQVLASLTHPNIAKLLDAGETDDARPYFVMEYVEGMPIDAYCDVNQLDTQRRLELFVKVCSAVQTAHANGIIHRDIKPANILVDRLGQPKLLDFGIAKALNPQIASVTVVTGPELRVMTPEYASPEQARGEPATTASDVYSLGVLLYELLTGKRPYTFSTRLREEMLRIVGDTQAVPAPSTVVVQTQTIASDDGTATTLTADQLATPREGNVEKLRRRLQGDLDNIVLKALQKPAPRRYQSSNELAEDILRHLAGRPVAARADSTVYVLSRFVARNRTAVVSASAAAVLVLCAMGFGLWKQGVASQRMVQLAAMRSYARMTVDNLAEEMRRTEGSLATRRVLMDSTTKVLASLKQVFPEDGAFDWEQARALRAMGDALGGRGQNLGQPTEALEHYTKALTLVTPTLPGVEETAQLQMRAGLRIDMASVWHSEGDGVQAKALADEAITILRAAGNDKGVRSLLGQALLLRASVANDEGDAAGAEKLLRESVSLRREVLASDRSDADSVRELTVALNRLGEQAEFAEPARLQEAAQLYEEALGLRKAIAAFGADATAKRDVVTSQKFLADVRVRLGEAKQARALLEEGKATIAGLLAATPDDARSERDMAELDWSLAYAIGAEGDAGGQREAMQRAAQRLVRLAQREGAGVSARRRAIDALVELAGMHASIPDAQSARAALRDATALIPTGDADAFEAQTARIDEAKRALGD